MVIHTVLTMINAGLMQQVNKVVVFINEQKYMNTKELKFKTQDQYCSIKLEITTIPAKLIPAWIVECSRVRAPKTIDNRPLRIIHTLKGTWMQGSAMDNFVMFYQNLSSNRCCFSDTQIQGFIHCYTPYCPRCSFHVLHTSGPLTLNSTISLYSFRRAYTYVIKGLLHLIPSDAIYIIIQFCKPICVSIFSDWSTTSNGLNDFS